MAGAHQARQHGHERALFRADLVDNVAGEALGGLGDQITQQGIGGRAVADEIVGQPGGEVLGSRGHASTVVPGRGDARRTRGASSGHVAPDGCGTAAVVT